MHFAEDKCLPDPCDVNETCVRNPEKSAGYECICDMGFVGDCGNCTGKLLDKFERDLF